MRSKKVVKSNNPYPVTGTENAREKIKLYQFSIIYE